MVTQELAQQLNKGWRRWFRRFRRFWLFVARAGELMEPLQIVSHTEQIPLQSSFLQPTQRELLKTQNSLNNPNDWFDTGLAA